jgi:ribosomal-protein-alanine N-acetyltransferase
MDVTSLTVRSMQLGDISQVSGIEREAFPPPWPPTNFRRDLAVNTSTHYVVACDQSQRGNTHSPYADEATAPHSSRLHTIRMAIERLLRADHASSGQTDFIVGFAGVWFLVDEAHLATIAVSKEFRRQAVGEHLLIGVIDLAIEHNASLVTLEVRATNTAAQALYEKYGFAVVGLRPGYYSDNKEDAILMTVNDIRSPSYQDDFRRLRDAVSRQPSSPVMP